MNNERLCDHTLFMRSILVVTMRFSETVQVFSETCVCVCVCGYERIVCTRSHGRLFRLISFPVINDAEILTPDILIICFWSDLSQNTRRLSSEAILLLIWLQHSQIGEESRHCTSFFHQHECCRVRSDRSHRASIFFCYMFHSTQPPT